MVYELRKWFDNYACLYTDDARVKEVAGKSPQLAIAASYFRGMREQQPFAWDIVGRPDDLAGLVDKVGKRHPHTAD
jgi:hypothetical protein